MTAFQNVADSLTALEQDAKALKAAAAADDRRQIDAGHHPVSVEGRLQQHAGAFCRPNRPISRRISRCCRPKPAAMPTPPRCFRRWAAAGGIAPILEKPMRNKFLLPAALAALCLVAGCGKSENAPANTGSNITLTAEQRRNITLTTVASGQLPQECGYDRHRGLRQRPGDRMLAPFSGTVSQLLVEPGQSVKKGEALAEVVSPDYASRGFHLSQGAGHRPERPQAGRPGQGSAGASGRLGQGSRAGRDRCRQRGSRPRCRPAGAAIAWRGSRA